MGISSLLTCGRPIFRPLALAFSMPDRTLALSDVVFHELVVHAFVGSLALGGLGLLFLDPQFKVRVGSHLSGQFLIFGAETLVSLVEACLGASDGLVEEVQGEADSGLGRSNDSIHNNFLSWLFGLCGRSQPLFSFF